MTTLSVIIPTYNEIDYIEDAIKSVDFADEIIVIDSFSTDGTKEKAIALGCKVLERKFDNFSKSKKPCYFFMLLVIGFYLLMLMKELLKN